MKKKSDFVNIRYGFTLIELLVVMATLGTLLSLLLPAVSIVKSSAKTANCMSNMRQLGLLCQNYSIQEKGSLPPWQAWTDQNFPKHRFWGIWPHWLDRAGLLDRGIGNAFLCPDTMFKKHEFRDNVADYEPWAKWMMYTSSYGMNPYLHQEYRFYFGASFMPENTKWLMYNPAPDAPFRTNFLYNQVKIRSSSQTILLSEKWGFSVWGGQPTVDPNGAVLAPFESTAMYGNDRRLPNAALGENKLSVRASHHKRSTYLMFDLHVETLTPESTFPTNFTGTQIPVAGSGAPNRWLDRY